MQAIMSLNYERIYHQLFQKLKIVYVSIYFKNIKCLRGTVTILPTNNSTYREEI